MSLRVRIVMIGLFGWQRHSVFLRRSKSVLNKQRVILVYFEASPGS